MLYNCMKRKKARGHSTDSDEAGTQILFAPGQQPLRKGQPKPETKTKTLGPAQRRKGRTSVGTTYLTPPPERSSTELVRGSRFALAERSPEAKARRKARKDALGRAGRALRSGRLGAKGRMETTYSDDDIRVGRAVQQKGTPFEKTFAQRTAADTRPNKGSTNLRNRGVRASTEIVRRARLALAERVLGEMYSGTVPKGSKARRDMSNKVGMERIVRRSKGGAQKTADVLRKSVDKVLNPKKTK
mgnify:CR=1 FL=1